jgi:hypothetical protein
MSLQCDCKGVSQVYIVLVLRTVLLNTICMFLKISLFGGISERRIIIIYYYFYYYYYYYYY